MPWLTKFLLVLGAMSVGCVQAQPGGPPPFFAGSSVLHNMDSLAAAISKLKDASDSSRPLRILHLGDSHVKSGYFAEAFADSLNRYFSEAAQKVVAVKLTVMAKNGATSKHFLEEPYNAAEVQSLQPDVIIISLGTNEAQNLYTKTDLQFFYTQLLAQIKVDAPAASIVFTTPGDALRKTVRTVKKRKRFYTVTDFSINAVLPIVIQFIKDFTLETGAAYWDWNTVMGGRGAINRWLAQGYAKDDRVHLTEKGYALQGWLLATAFIKLFKTEIAK